MIETIEFFAQHLLNLTPVKPGSFKGFYATVKRHEPKLSKRVKRKQDFITFFVSHEQVLQQYSAANRFIRGLGYDPKMMGRTIEGIPYLCFAKQVNDKTFMFRKAITPGMETLFDQPLTGGKQ